LPTIKLKIPEVILQQDIKYDTSLYNKNSTISIAKYLHPLSNKPHSYTYTILYDLTSAEDLTPVQSTICHSLATLYR